MKSILGLFSKKRAFWQMYLIIIITVVVIITSLGFIYHNSIKSKLTNEYLDNGRNLLLQSRSALNHIISTVYNASSQVQVNKNFMYLVRNNEKLNAIDRGSILHVLRQVKSSSEYIESVSLYIKKGNEIYCTDYAYSTLENYPDKEYINQFITRTDPLFLVNQRDIRKSFFPSFKAPYKVITMLYVLERSENEENNNLMVINMDVDKVYESVINVLDVSGETEIFVISEEGELILGNTKSQLIDMVMSDDVLEDIIHSEGSQNFVTWNKKKYLKNSVSLELLAQNMNLVWITNHDALDTILKPFRSFCIIVSTVLILIALTIEIFVIMRKTRQIDELIYETFSEKESYTKGKNVFANLYNYVNNINENNAMMKEKLDRVKIVFRENYLRGLLIKSNPDNQEQIDVYTRLEEYDIFFKFENFRVITIDIINMHEFSEKHLNANMVKYSLEELLSFNLQKSALKGEKVSINDDRISLILNIPKRTPDENLLLINTFIKNAGNDINKYPDVNVAIGISGEGFSTGELNTLYRQSIKVMKYRLVEKQNTVMFYDEIGDVSGSIFEQDNAEIEEKLTGYIMIGDEENAKKLLDIVFVRLKEDGNVTEKELQSSVLHLISILMLISTKLEIDLHAEMGDSASIYEILGRIKMINEAEVFFAELVKKLCIRVKENSDTLEVCYLKRILNYIDENYSEDISMDVLSQNIGISSSYIQKIFKDKLKTTFVKYLTKKRMEKACEYLEQGMKVKEISDRLGFANSKYFIQVFKKHLGCTPNEVKKVISS